MTQTIDANERSKWPHRVAVLLVCATFPLIWVGGLVTTYDAGMAVPDWPNTYGYNLFLYPLSTWLSGPWDLFIEHGHRLLASIVGLITIGFVAVTWRFDSRVWFRRFSLVCLALVITQGVLGGLRVVLDRNVLARLHGCVGPLFFVTTVVSAAFASRWWHEQETSIERRPSPSFVRTAWLTVGLVYLQLILGAHLRHLNPSWPPRVFSTFVVAHLFVAAAILIHSVWLAIAARRISIAKVRRLSTVMLLLVIAQLALGAGAWRMRYNWPDWLPQPQSLVGYTVTAESMSQTVTITGHVALGSLILAAAALLAVRSSRVRKYQDKIQPVSSQKISASRLEVVA